MADKRGKQKWHSPFPLYATREDKKKQAIWLALQRASKEGSDGAGQGDRGI